MISVAMATYNGEKYIRRQLDSIIHQDILPDEIVIVDDASSDNTIFIVNNYVAQYKQIHWQVVVNSHNIGWKQNFAKAILLTHGDIIFLADQDDYWRENKVRLMSKAMYSNPDIRVLASEYKTFNSDLFNEGRDSSFIIKNEKIVEKKRFTSHYYMTHYPGCSFAIRADVKKWFSFDEWDGTLPHDEYLWVVAQMFDSAYILKSVVLCYLRHPGAATAKQRRSRERRIELLKEKYQCAQKMISIMLRSNICNRDEKLQQMNESIEFLENRISFLEKPTFQLLVWLVAHLSRYERIAFFVIDLFSVFL